MTTELLDVIQIGYGPVGQVSAALLGQRGHSVAVIEKHPDLYSLPRAGHMDHEAMRIFQSVGIADHILEDAVRAGHYEFRNQHGEVLIAFDWDADGISGWASDYYFFQPHIEAGMDRVVESLPSVRLYEGYEAFEIVQDEDHVTVKMRSRADGSEHTLKARYLIGADGGNSFTRATLGIPEEDLGFRERWLVVDYRLTKPVEFPFDEGQICDPARPRNLFKLGKRHRRFAFMVLPHEDTDAMRSEDAAWALTALHGVTPDNAVLVRNTVYVFQSRTALDWRRGRALLMGDAAHVMPPFLGQGLCSGLRDAANLAWRLDLVLRGEAPDELLDTYGEERRDHTMRITRMSIEAGRLAVTIDPELAAQRDEGYRKGTIPPPPPFPTLREGLFQKDADGAVPVPAGTLAPQGVVRRGDRVARFDDVVGAGWTLIVSDVGMLEALEPEKREVLERLECRVLSADGRGEIVPEDDVYRDYLDVQGVDAVLYRPDFYVFGAVRPGESLGELIDSLEAQLLSRRDRAAAGAAR